MECRSSKRSGYRFLTVIAVVAALLVATMVSICYANGWVVKLQTLPVKTASSWAALTSSTRQ